jgi:preprotein translocase subunit SecB
MSDAQQNNQPVFSIEKLYVKDLSLEIPNAPQAFLERETPTAHFRVQN